jgi:hypothetical protein
MILVGRIHQKPRQLRLNHNIVAVVKVRKGEEYD